ncbi:hypothetical protein RCL1_007826 [Eukaryota sp. TZLM3-RCL]
MSSLPQSLLFLDVHIPNEYIFIVPTQSLTKIMKLVHSLKQKRSHLLLAGQQLSHEFSLIEQIVYKSRNSLRAWSSFKQFLRLRQCLNKLQKIDPVLLVDSFLNLFSLPESNVPLTDAPLPTSDAVFFTLFKFLHFVYLLAELNYACTQTSQRLTRQLQVKHLLPVMMVLLSTTSSLFKCIDPLIKNLDDIYGGIALFRKVLSPPVSDNLLNICSIKFISHIRPTDLFAFLLNTSERSNLFYRFTLFFEESKKKKSSQREDYGEIID